MSFLKNIPIRKYIKKLASLQLALYLLFMVGIFIAIGTFIEQDQSLTFYKNNYPIDNPILGFITWEFIVFLQLNQIYTSYFFIFLLLFFGTTLICCTFTTQLPSLKKFRLWQFINNTERLNKFACNENFFRATTNSIVYQLNRDNFHNFRQNKNNYAYSGLLGRFAPIVVHFSILFLLLGSSIGSLKGFTAQEIIPRGEVFHVQNLVTSGNFSQVPSNLSWRVNDFWITYTKEFKTNQFYSDLSLLDNKGNELKRKTVFVNEPFVYNGLTLYQTDWNIIGLKLRLDSSNVFQVPLKKISKNGRTFWFGFIPSTPDKEEKITIVANDLSGKIFLYNNKGQLIKEHFLGDQILIGDEISLQLLDFITSTGVQIKTDPGLQTVYFSFFFLMCSTYISFISYSQVWGIEEKKYLLLAGTSNRAVLYFQEEFRKIKIKINKNKKFKENIRLN